MIRANPEFLITGLGAPGREGQRERERGKRDSLHDHNELKGQLKSRNYFHIFGEL